MGIGSLFLLQHREKKTKREIRKADIQAVVGES
jgi:hypothetical protein